MDLYSRTPSFPSPYPLSNNPLHVYTYITDPPSGTQLFTVSLLTIFALAATIGLHCFYGLNAALNTALNTSLAVLWGVSFALLSWWSAGTLAHECNVGSWESDTGVSVCRLYKALFSFALLGLASTVFALVLDVRVQRSATNRGQFQQLDTLGDGGKREGHVRDYAGESGGTTVPAMRGERDRDGRGGEGYALPEEQFAYDESYAYTGSAGRVGRRSLDGRL